MINRLILLLLLLVQGCAAIKSGITGFNESMDHYRLGVSYLDKGDTTSAIKELLEAERLYNKEPKIFHKLGLAYYKKGEIDLAVQQFKKAMELGPDNEIITEEFNIISKKLKELYVVSEKFRNAIDTSLAEAASSIKAGRYSDAIANYKAVLLIDQENKEAAAGLQNAAKLRNEVVDKILTVGIKGYKEGNYYQAMLTSNEVLQIDSKNVEAQKLRKDAKARIDELLTPWIKEGVEAYKKGDMDTAIISFKKVLNVEPGNKEARGYLGKIDAQKTMVSIGKEIERHYLRGIKLYTDGKYEEAIESWRKVLELEPKHEKAIMNIEKAKKKMEGVIKTK